MTYAVTAFREGMFVRLEVTDPETGKVSITYLDGAAAVSIGNQLVEAGKQAAYVQALAGR